MAESKPKKKKAKEPASTEVSDSTFVVNDSTNTSFIIGNENRADQKANQQRPVEVLPYSGSELSWVSLGRRIMNRLYGTLDHGMKLYTFIISMLTVGAGTPIYLVLAPPYRYGSDPYVMMGLLFLGLVAFVAVFYFGWGVILTSRETRCPKCRLRFMYYRKRRFLTGQGEHLDRRVVNYKSTYSCDNCGYRKNVNEIVERQISV